MDTPWEKCMRRYSVPLFAAAGALLAACSTPDRLPLSPTGDPASLRGESATPSLVTFRSDVTDIRGVANEMASRGGFALDNVREHAARGFTANIPPAFVESVRNDPRVAIFEPDGVVTLDLPRAQAGRPSPGQQISYGLTRVGGST